MLLNCHTYYSLRYGTLSLEQLLAEAKAKGYGQIVLTDINNTSACVNMMRMAPEQSMKPIMGIDFRNGIQQQYVGIAMNNQGFAELNEHLSQHLHNEMEFDVQAPSFNNSYIIYPLSAYKGWALRENEYIGIHARELNSLLLKKGLDERKMVVLQPATFTDKRSFNTHRLLRAIDKNVLLSMLPVAEQSSPDEVMLPKDELYKLFADHPQIIQNTEHILNTSEVKVEFGKFANKNKKSWTGSIGEDHELLRVECLKSLPYRYPQQTDEVMKRMEKELEIIGQMGFASYFLINWDIVSYARSKGYYYVGRGSGANSMVAYLLRITDVDPIDLDLYFERFINPFRSTPPDFDIDFSWTDRDDITDYIFKRYGANGKAALLGAYNTFQFKSVTRELGKVFGLPPGEIDALQRNLDPAKTDEIGRLVLGYSKLIDGFPSHLSIHSSGIIISEEPLSHYCATFMPPKGYPTTQFSMIEAEDIGLYKFDILSQRGLGKIKDSLGLIKQNHKVEVDIHDFKKFYQDENVKVLLRQGKAIGCFYVESPAMRMLLCKLQADDYLRLVAASSIIRPGVAKSGMMREYILRYRNPELREKARAALPELYDILAETYGVMVYQEDVIRVAHEFAGLTLAEADYLRRGMSWKFKQRNEFDRVQQQFFDNCKAKGYPMDLISNVWTQIESFANFAFSKGHSASYAVESYQALFLKAYYPLEYMVATLNNGGGFYRPEVYIHEARMHGGIIHPPCVNQSKIGCSIFGKDIYLGLGMIAEMEHGFAEELLKEREANGGFLSLHDFVKRVYPSIEQLRLLIRAGAFSFTQKSKQALLWEAHLLLSGSKPQKNIKPLFEESVKEFKLPVLEQNPIDDFYDHIELFGFPPNLPFDMLKDDLPCNSTAAQLKEQIGYEFSIVGYLVTIKYAGTSKGERMYFGTFLDVEGQWIDTVHFPPSARAYPFRGLGCYLLTGKVTVEFDFYTLEVSKMERLAYLNRD